MIFARVAAVLQILMKQIASQCLYPVVQTSMIVAQMTQARILTNYHTLDWQLRQLSLKT